MGPVGSISGTSTLGHARNSTLFLREEKQGLGRKQKSRRRPEDTLGSVLLEARSGKWVVWKGSDQWFSAKAMPGDF